ncbi:MAG: hypothetical protein ABEH78_08215 [Haloferacaceae archaeon]
MAHYDGGWRPRGATETYNGFEVWDHGIGPHELNHGEVDGDISFDDIESE